MLPLINKDPPQAIIFSGCRSRPGWCCAIIVGVNTHLPLCSHCAVHFVPIGQAPARRTSPPWCGVLELATAHNHTNAHTSTQTHAPASSGKCHRVHWCAWSAPALAATDSVLGHARACQVATWDMSQVATWHYMYQVATWHSHREGRIQRPLRIGHARWTCS